MEINRRIAEELKVEKWRVDAAVKLLDEGCTVPFIARYRKEATGTLDDAQLRDLSTKLVYLRGLEEKKQQVLAEIESQGKLTEELRAKIGAADSLVAVDDLYRPFRPKRRTRAGIAREKGLQPLADYIFAQEAAEPVLRKAAEFVTSDAGLPEEKQVATPEEALQGAEDILAEQISDNADYRTWIRGITLEKGTVTSAEKPAAAGTRPSKLEERRSVYEMYFNYEEVLKKVPGYRVLALDRGEEEKFLTVKIAAPEEEILAYLLLHTLRDPKAPNRYCEPVLKEIVKDSYGRLIAPAIERELRGQLTEKAQDGAIRVFDENLKQLLMQQPVAGRTVLGWDPAFRTGCKLAVVDPTGKVLDTKVIFPTAPQNKVEEADAVLQKLISDYDVTLFSVGNGTASRESEQVISDLFRRLNSEPGRKEPLRYVIVNEAGASVYSASELASEEFPAFDVGQRSAVSIARRLQDPLAELVKIDPKAIGVGQYQHDMDQKKLGDALTGVVEDCVNSVGVDLNTASGALLSYISGITPAAARNIVAYREKNGRFRSRRELLKVAKIGPRAYEQCAGFLRIRGGSEPLDMTSVHPESYPAVKQLLSELGLQEDPASFRLVKGMVRDPEKTASRLGLGAITLQDILKELEKPARDPREDMPAPVLRSDVLSLDDLVPGMKLKGTVRNIVDFGVFVDIGVHQDGLVHISRMSHRFIKHPLEVVHVGDVVDVTVLSVDRERKRIALSMVEASD
ncbi:MAG: RNA-binding transcriptional accessory protein [Lachnospiraceae bacterium]|nr:RNA-binding transcriptional accessory protein [Lachnospiraceae bacterium]